MKINLHSPTEEAQIHILPLIDVVFCILTFFLLAALNFTRQQAINVDLPKASSGTSATTNIQGKRNILPITIDAVGLTYVEKQQVDETQLKSNLKKYLEENPQGTLVLNASRSATYNDVVKLLDLLRQVGGERVALGIIPGQEASSQQPLSPNLNPSINNPGLPVLPNSLPPNSLQKTPNNSEINPSFNNIPLPTLPIQPKTSSPAPQAPPAPNQ
ncbi:biopolymer transporter ExbD [Mastigocoleus sp. MO_188.B34]|uniref:ExbD/TolR family protein n=1 Tax=Mastigocoleus sp. MO_188.B34 TaxID=3036635 RepID=UPI002626F3EB|nr:biopolymer transporter ExbD [Mastigocoleus sp. MO_188.B34]MDJ0697835.1 biopolymer transporter ExbD [Mastigocoleus sp. MO_188.B34]